MYFPTSSILDRVPKLALSIEKTLMAMRLVKP